MLICRMILRKTNLNLMVIKENWKGNMVITH